MVSVRSTCLSGAGAGARQLSGIVALIGWIGGRAAGGPGQRNPTNRCSVAGSRHGVPGEVRGKFCRPNKRVVVNVDGKFHFHKNTTPKHQDIPVVYLCRWRFLPLAFQKAQLLKTRSPLVVLVGLALDKKSGCRGYLPRKLESPNSHLPLEQQPVHTHWHLPDPADSAPRNNHTPHTRRLNRRIGSSQPQWPPSAAEESCGRGPAHHHRHHPPNPLAPPSSPTAASSRAP